MNDYLNQTDEDLLKGFRVKGDPLCLDTLFLRYIDVGFRTAMRYMRNETDAEDVLQTAFILFVKNIDSFREGSSTVKPWLMKIIVNACLSRIREEKRRSRRQQSVAIERFSEYEKNSESSHMSIEQDELKDKIKSAVDTLPEKYRSPICLVLYEGFSYSEVATVLAMPETTVRTQVARGLKKLRVLLEPLGLPLSTAIIINLMAESKLEAAPAAIKKDLLFSSLQKSLSGQSSESARHVMQWKMPMHPSFFSFKFLWILISVLTVVGGGYVLNQKIKQVSREVAISPKQYFEQDDINQTWVFANEADRDMKIVRGSWEWSEKHKGMAPPINAQAFISLPFGAHEKCIVVEAVLVPLHTKATPKMEAAFDCFWVADHKILKHQSVKPYKYVLKENTPFTIRSYLYRNYVYAITPDNFFNVQKYPEDLSDSNIMILLQHYAIQRLSCYTLKEIPAEVQHAIETFSPYSSFDEINLK